MHRQRLLDEYPLLAPILTSQRALLDDCAAVCSRFDELGSALEPYIRPLDDASPAEHAALLEQVLTIACDARVFSLALPQCLGGGGHTVLSLAMGLERLAQRCAGLSSLFGTHGLAIALLGAAGNSELLIQIARRIVTDERRGKAFLLSTAATEPSAGSDLEDEEELGRARLTSIAEPVATGYRLRGTKIYVSNGSLASAHVVLMPLDRTRPRETLNAFLVPHDSPGLKVVRTERKLGQRASPAAELHFDGCLVPAAARISAETVSGRCLDLVLGASRSFIGAFGAGIARGVYDTCVAINPPKHPCHRTLLGRMWSNAREARSSYVEASLVNAREGLVSFSENELIRLLDRFIPASITGSGVAQKLLERLPLNGQTRKLLAKLEPSGIERTCCYGSSTKARTSELALDNCRLAFTLLGATATREETGLPKYARDARLLAIYEGTNEICLIDVDKRAQRLARGITR